jgi:hypothetical protein
MWVDSLDQILKKQEVIVGLKEIVWTRLLFCSERERSEVEALSGRALNPQCSFDREHRLMLYALAVAPDQVGWSFKLKERVHRLFHKR